MSKKILITGGAGFVGSHLADELLDHGYEVRVLDCLHPQVHGSAIGKPEYLAEDIDLIRGDIRDPQVVWRALNGVSVVFHLAAAVGVGQSMYEIEHYTSANGLGTAVLLEALAKRRVEKLVVASSMSIYGEGLYKNSSGERVVGAERPLSQLKQHDWEVRGAGGEALEPVPTPESKCPALPSVYAISKYHQERLCMVVGRAYGIPTVGLRFFNIFGTRQALSNPYTGVLAIFAARLLNDRPPLINEDGYQQRDFVSVRDIVRACRLAMEVPAAADHVLNIGSGEPLTVRQVAAKMGRVLGKSHIEAEVTGNNRMGDIRNCFADISLAQEVLGYRPRVTLEKGLVELAEWLQGQTAVDNVASAADELVSRGLTV